MLLERVGRAPDELQCARLLLARMFGITAISGSMGDRFC